MRGKPSYIIDSGAETHIFVCQKCGEQGGLSVFEDECRNSAEQHARTHDGDSRCTIAGCEKEINSRGLCSTHYSRARKAGTLTPLTASTGTGTCCRAAQCDRTATARGLCMLHYKRARRLIGVEHLSPAHTALTAAHEALIA